MGTFYFQCPFCWQKLECDDSMEGQKSICPACEKEIIPRKKKPKTEQEEQQQVVHVRKEPLPPPPPPTPEKTENEDKVDIKDFIRKPPSKIIKSSDIKNSGNFYFSSRADYILLLVLLFIPFVNLLGYCGTVHLLYKTFISFLMEKSPERADLTCKAFSLWVAYLPVAVIISFFTVVAIGLLRGGY